MTLVEYYRDLRELERPMHPAKVFIHQLAKLTGRSPKTVEQWVCGIQQPSMAVRIMISEKIGIPHEELFPQLECVCVPSEPL